MYTGVYKRENFWEWWGIDSIGFSTKTMTDEFAAQTGANNLYWEYDSSGYKIVGDLEYGSFLCYASYDFATGFSLSGVNRTNIADIWVYNELDDEVAFRTALFYNSKTRRYIGYVDLGPTGKTLPYDNSIIFPSGELLLF